MAFWRARAHGTRVILVGSRGRGQTPGSSADIKREDGRTTYDTDHLLGWEMDLSGDEFRIRWPRGKGRRTAGSRDMQLRRFGLRYERAREGWVELRWRG